MGKYICTGLLIFFIVHVIFTYGQTTDTNANAPTKKAHVRPAKRCVIWFTPTRAKEINGIALGTIPSSIAYNNDNLTINGIHLEANPIMLMLVPYVLIGSITSPFRKEGDSSYFNNAPPDSIQYKSGKSINGVNVSTFGSGEMSNYNGVNISSLVTFGHSIKGLSITIGQNNVYSFSGLLIAGLLNNANNGHGVQIGLFNRCKYCKGVQIGLLNKMGNRTFPFLNMRL